MKSFGPRADSRRLTPVLIGGIVTGVLAVALAVTAGGSEPDTDSGSSEPMATDAAIAAVTTDAAPGPDARSTNINSTKKPEVLPDAPRQSDPATSSSEIEVECLGYQFNQRWDDLDACSERLKPINPTVAKQLKERAVLETRAVPRIAAFETAIRDRNLKTAGAQLEAISPQATGYTKLRQRYEQAENEAIRDLAQRLERVKKLDCKEYNQLLQQEKWSKPPRVAAEAQRQVRCTPAQPTSPPIACNDEDLADTGKEQFALSRHTAALTAYEQAWSCNPDPAYAEKAFIVACNIPSPMKAKLHWKRMPTVMRARALEICVRNGITADVLDGP
jgi:hypothetical protein